MSDEDDYDEQEDEGHEQPQARPAVPHLEEDSSINCVCNSKFDNKGLCVCCDGCDKWSHAVCVGLNASNLPEKWFCRNCGSKVAKPFQGFTNGAVQLPLAAPAASAHAVASAAAAAAAAAPSSSPAGHGQKREREEEPADRAASPKKADHE